MIPSNNYRFPVTTDHLYVSWNVSTIPNLNEIISVISCDKYGRVLAEVYDGDINVNQWMIDEKYASLFFSPTCIHSYDLFSKG